MSMRYTEDRLTTFSDPPSKTELEKVKHTADMIADVLGKNLPKENIKATHSLSSFNYEVYLQGSYANRTNISFASDIDIVVQLTSVHGYNLDSLTELEKKSFHDDHSTSNYQLTQFKADVLKALKARFGEAATEGNKCLKIRENSTRVNADVIPCLEYRVYKRYMYKYDSTNFIPGIKFYDKEGSMIINYPKLHQANTKIKQDSTNKQYKKQVRIFKNIRQEMIEQGVIDKSVATSYWIENLLYNCTDDCFSNDKHGENMVACLQFLYDAFENARESGFICANGQQSLFSDETWDALEASDFITKFAKFSLDI